MMKFTTVEDGKHLEYLESIASTEPCGRLILLFYASLDKETGKSWCGDCRDLDPVLQSLASNELEKEDLTLAKIYVGQRQDWRDQNNYFRTCDYKITAVPTLNQRLVESECLDRERVKNFLATT